LLSEEELELNWNLRKTFSEYNQVETMQMMIDTMKKTKSNKDLLRAAPVVFGRKEYARNGF
jgi:transcription termination factor Rho